MESVFCRACGKQVDKTAAYCGSCGTAQASPGQAAVTADAADAHWTATFALIDKAGGPKLPKIWSMSYKDIWAIRFNPLAFFFGPIYYAKMGMWRKGLSLTGIGVVVVAIGCSILEVLGTNPDFFMLYLPGLLMGQANVSYYKFVKSGQNAWW